MILDHQRAEFPDALTVSLLLRHISHRDFREAAFRRISVKREVRDVRGEGYERKH